MDQMGILDDVSRLACPVDGYEVVAPNGRSTTAPIASPYGAMVVPRLALDDLILRRAIGSGARFESRVTVAGVEPTAGGARVITQGGQSFDGRVAIVATGAATSVLHKSGILKKRPRALLAARAYFEDIRSEVARRFQLRFDGVPMPGYGWVFPVGRNAANVGVGFMPSPRSGTAAPAFERFARGTAVRRILAGARRVGPVKGYPIRVDFLSSPTYAHRTLLVGEAAGLVNPLTGEGIDYALESGLIAADHVAGALGTSFDGGWEANYDRLLRRRFERIFRFSEWIRDWYCKPLLLNLLVPLANRRPELRQLLASIVLGEREPRGYGPATMAARLAVYLARHRGAPMRQKPYD
jgi:flavin-dependent dehydrogenase